MRWRGHRPLPRTDEAMTHEEARARTYPTGNARKQRGQLGVLLGHGQPPPGRLGIRARRSGVGEEQRRWWTPSIHGRVGIWEEAAAAAALLGLVCGRN
jgi:hypothetical protein